MSQTNDDERAAGDGSIVDVTVSRRTWKRLEAAAAGLGVTPEAAAERFVRLGLEDFSRGSRDGRGRSGG